jgi:hypothetical protein
MLELKRTDRKLQSRASKKTANKYQNGNIKSKSDLKVRNVGWINKWTKSFELSRNSKEDWLL